MDKKHWKTNLKNFWLKYEPKIVLVLGFVLVAGLSFEAGILKGREMPQNPIIIEKPVESATVDSSASGNASEAQNSLQEPQKDSRNSNIQPQNCAFSGSKNSNKYHLPTCSYAKNIKPENRVCFSSKDEAQSKGYLPDKNCIK